MVQYEMYFTNEYTEEIISDLCNIMKLPYSDEKVNKAMSEKDIYSKDNLLIIQNEECFICTNCSNIDYIYPLIIRCPDVLSEAVNQCMFTWDQQIRLEYCQEPSKGIPNVYGNDNTLLKYLEDVYQMRFL